MSGMVHEEEDGERLAVGDEVWLLCIYIEF